VSLFADIEIRPRRSRRVRARGTIQIPTGSPRLIESPTDRRVREKSEMLAAFADDIVQSARARLVLFSGRDAAEVTTCPWSMIYDGSCPASCRCGGTGGVEVGFLVAHYKQLAAEFSA